MHINLPEWTMLIFAFIYPLGLLFFLNLSDDFDPSDLSLRSEKQLVCH